MKAKKQDYKRINFQLPLSLAKDFELAAQREGVTKAKLLRRWIENTNNLSDTVRVYESVKKSFNLRLSSSTYKDIRDLSRKYQISNSRTLRQIISGHTGLTLIYSDQKASDDLQELWRKGLIAQILEKTSAIPDEKLDFTTKVLVIKSLTDMGDHLTAWDQLIKLEAKDIHDSDIKTVALYLNKASIYMSVLKVDEAFKTLKAILPTTLNTANQYFISRNYYLIGKIYATLEQISEALDYYQKALRYLDVLHYPLEMGLIYLRMHKLYSSQLNLAEAKKCFSLAEDLINTSGNAYYKTCLANEKTSFLYLQGDFDAADEELVKASELNKINNSISQSFYNTELSARINLVKGNHNDAARLFDEAERMERSIKGTLNFSKVRLMQSYIQSKYNYKAAINDLNESVNLQLRPVRKNWGQYLLASAMFINAPTEKDKKTGERMLNQFISESTIPMLAKAAESTLLKSILYPL
jgi:tetratricopeptide (TPR) repeat protein